MYLRTRRATIHGNKHLHFVCWTERGNRWATAPATHGILSNATHRDDSCYQHGPYRHTHTHIAPTHAHPATLSTITRYPHTTLQHTHNTTTHHQPPLQHHAETHTTSHIAHHTTTHTTSYTAHHTTTHTTSSSSHCTAIHTLSYYTSQTTPQVVSCLKSQARKSFPAFAANNTRPKYTSCEIYANYAIGIHSAENSTFYCGQTYTRGNFFIQGIIHEHCCEYY